MKTTETTLSKRRQKKNLKQRLIPFFKRKQWNDSYVIPVCMYNECTRFIVTCKYSSIKPNGLLIFNESNEGKEP